MTQAERNRTPAAKAQAKIRYGQRRQLISGRNKTRYEHGRLLISQMKAKPCADCGIQYPACAMQYDHRDRSAKLFNIGNSARRSAEQLLAEIAKCDVVCANCHAIRTHGVSRAW